MAVPTHRIFKSWCWAHFNDDLTDADYGQAASRLGSDRAAIRAVADTEVAGEAWDFMGRPRLLFERHKFHKHTRGAYDTTHPGISARSAGGYGSESRQYDRLYEAATLDEPAALKSASYGMFQILGENHVAAGFATVEAFVDAMLRSQRDHLLAFVSIVGANRLLKGAIHDHRWAAFARGYNGKGYAKNHYGTKMASAYARLSN